MCARCGEYVQVLSVGWSEVLVVRVSSALAIRPRESESRPTGAVYIESKREREREGV